MAEREQDGPAPDSNGQPGRAPADDELSVTISWPAGWATVYLERTAGGSDERDPTKATQRVRFVGGSADGLSDLVLEATPGRLPRDLETMGSVYRLVGNSGDGPSYHWNGFERN